MPRRTVIELPKVGGRNFRVDRADRPPIPDRDVRDVYRVTRPVTSGLSVRRRRRRWSDVGATPEIVKRNFFFQSDSVKCAVL